MVRNLVGTFMLVGKGTLKVEDITRILEARSRVGGGCNRAGERAVSGGRGVLDHLGYTEAPNVL